MRQWRGRDWTRAEKVKKGHQEKEEIEKKIRQSTWENRVSHHTGKRQFEFQQLIKLSQRNYNYVCLGPAQYMIFRIKGHKYWLFV